MRGLVLVSRVIFMRVFALRVRRWRVRDSSVEISAFYLPGESSHYTLPRVVTELCDRVIVCYLCDVWHCIISM